MGLRDRLYNKPNPEPDKPEESEASRKSEEAQEKQAAFSRSHAYQQMKLMLHRQLIEHIDTSRLLSMDSESTRRQVRALLEQIVEREKLPLNKEERAQLIEDLEYETFGLGPIEPLLKDPTVNDILVNRYDEVFIERGGRLERTDVMFRDNEHLLQVVERMVSKVGRRIDESSPLVDARLSDGSRVNAIIPPLAIDGPSISIRRAKQDPFNVNDLMNMGALNKFMASLLEAVIKAKLNVIISGGSGSGKTTLLNALLRFIAHNERIVSIEDTAELRLEGLHSVRLETRPANIEGTGEVTQRDLVKNALRMRPDRILVGEVRGAESFDMLQAMNTGHRGSITTIHANTPRDALARLETMILMAGVNLTSEAMRRQISSAIDVIIQLNRFPDGTRRMVSVAEVVGMEEHIIKLQELARFEQGKGSAFNVSRGNFVGTGVIPSFMDELQRTGVNLPTHLFARPSSSNQGG